MTSQPELNGNASCLGKRKKNRGKKTTPNLHNYLDQTMPVHSNGEGFPNSYGGYIPPNFGNSQYWQSMMPNQRLYPAVSDPSVCTYPLPMPVRYPIEPMSLPVYTMYPPQPAWQSTTDLNSHSVNNPRNKKWRSPKPATSTDSVYSSKNNDSVQNQDYTSLPPIINQLIAEDNDNKRRFSDPGIGPLSSDSEASSGRSSVITVDNNDNKLLYTLVEQINCLKESNRRLFKELHEVRADLSVLKQQTIVWNRKERDYEPGALADIIREVRDAAKVREDALLTRVRHMIEEKTFNQTFFSPVAPVRDIDELKCQLKTAIAEKNDTVERLEKVEEQLQNLKLNSSSGGDVNSSMERGPASGAHQVFELEKETFQLRRELQEAMAGRKEAESKSNKLEQYVNMLQKKMINTENVGEASGISLPHNDSLLRNRIRTADTGTMSSNKSSPDRNSSPLVAEHANSISSFDSVNSSPSHHVVMSGPVTDL